MNGTKFDRVSSVKWLFGAIGSVTGLSNENEWEADPSDAEQIISENYQGHDWFQNNETIGPSAFLSEMEIFRDLSPNLNIFVGDVFILHDQVVSIVSIRGNYPEHIDIYSDEWSEHKAKIEKLLGLGPDPAVRDIEDYEDYFEYQGVSVVEFKEERITGWEFETHEGGIMIERCELGHLIRSGTDCSLPGHSSVAADDSDVSDHPDHPDEDSNPS